MIRVAPPPLSALETPVAGWSDADDTAAHPQERSRRTRRLLILSACRQFDLHGYDAASLRHIVADAKVTKGALYFHFRSKGELADAIIEEIFASWRLVGAEIAGRGLDPLWRLLVETDAAVARWMFDPVVRGGSKVMRESTSFPEARATELQRWEDQVAARFAEARRDGLLRTHVDPSRAARMLLALMSGHYSLAEAMPDHPATPSYWHRMSDAWRGLLPAVATDAWLDGWADSAWGARAAPSARAYATARRP